MDGPHAFLPATMPLPSVLDLLATLGLGAMLGFGGGLFGIGGGIIAIPLFVLAFDMPQAQAQGTALVMMAPNLLLGWWRYQQRQAPAWRATATLAVTASLATALLAPLAARSPAALLRLGFAVFLLVVALRQLRQRQAARANATVLAPRWLPLVGLAGGSSMGVLGVGGGLVATPLLTRLFGHGQAQAQRLAMAMVAPSSLVALFSYARAGQVDWALGLPMAASGLLTVSAGVALAHRLPEARLRRAFAWLLVATGLWLLLGLLVHH